MRAITIEVNEFSSVGGMITPGARVDVLSTMQDARQREMMIRTIVQNVLVKAVGQSTGQPQGRSEEPGQVRSATLLVTSKQAEAIQLSTVAGRPWLVLRGSFDDSIAAATGTTLSELRGTAAHPARALLAALKPTQMPQALKAPASPATKPADAGPVRSVPVIRATVENLVTVAPSGPQIEAYTSATVEP